MCEIKTYKTCLGDVERTKRQCLHHNTAASTPTTAVIIITATKTTTIYSTATITAITITSGNTSIATRAKGIKAKI